MMRLYNKIISPNQQDPKSSIELRVTSSDPLLMSRKLPAAGLGFSPSSSMSRKDGFRMIERRV
jgi:hypothetical protein